MTEVLVPDDGGDTMRACDVDGVVCALVTSTAPEIKKILESLPKFPLRKNDVMLCSFPKNGTNWSYEILSMLTRKSSVRKEGSKLTTMIDAVRVETANAEPSPRVLNSHHTPRFLPIAEMRKKQVKTVLVVRNPKDTAVSYYNHMSGLTVYEYTGEWKNWLKPFLDGKLEYGSHAAYLNDWQKLIEQGPGFPLHIVYYEDLKQNGSKELDKLIKFLDVDIDSNLKHDILEMCRFEKMRIERDFDFGNRVDFKFFRKGEVGDWKNWFTIAQNEMFNAIWKKTIRPDTMFNFTYT